MTDLVDFFLSTSEPESSRQVRRAQERAAAKVAARQASVASQHNPCHMSARIGYKRMINLVVQDIRGDLKISSQPETSLVRDVERAREAWLKRIHRQGQVPVEEVYCEALDGTYLIAPSRRGNQDRPELLVVIAISAGAGYPVRCGSSTQPGEHRALLAHANLAIAAASAHDQLKIAAALEKIRAGGL